MADNKFSIEILEDGKISIDSNSFDGKVHADADKFLKVLKELMGGPTETIKKKGEHVHLVNGAKISHHH